MRVAAVNAADGTPATSAIALRGISFRYPGADRQALQDITLDVPRGCSLGLLGPNGAGKTTLLAILSGLLPVQAGSVRIAGLELPANANAVRARSALVPQEYAFYGALSGAENLRFFAAIHGLEGDRWRARRDYCVEVCGLGDYLQQRAGQYSGGLKRRLNLAIGMLNAPEILYLDEPTVGIDARSRQVVLEAIRALRAGGTTLVYTSHYLEEVESVCDEIAVIDRGRLVARDSTARLLQRDASRSLWLEFAAPPAAATLPALAPWSARALDERHFELTVADAAALASVIQVCVAQGLEIRQLRFGADRLERLYLEALK